MKIAFKSLNASELRQVELRASAAQARQATTFSILAAMGLSACGGGGGGGAGSSGTGATQSPTLPVVDVEPEAPTVTTGNNLTLVPSGSEYVSTPVIGFRQVNNNAYYEIADASSNSYDINLSATGSGALTFDFLDQNDVITLASGSVIDGFTDLNVINGTVDASNAEMDSVVNVSVASSIKLTAAQVLSLEAIVINEASGEVDILVSTDAELEQLNSAVAGGSLKVFSPSENLLSVSVAEGASVSQEKLQSSKSTLSEETRPVAEAVELGIAKPLDEIKEEPDAAAPPVTWTPIPVVSVPTAPASTPTAPTGGTQSSTPQVTQVGSATILVANADNGLIVSERVEPISINITPESGSSVVSVSVSGQSAANVAGDLYQFNGSNLVSGYHTVSVLTQDGSGARSQTEAQFQVIGSSSVGSQLFDIRTSIADDVITFSGYVKNTHVDLVNGIPSFDYFINLDENQLDYIEGSYSAASGATALTNENNANGEIFATGYFSTPWEEYDNPFFEFKANVLESLDSYTLSFSNVALYHSEVSDFLLIADV